MIFNQWCVILESREVNRGALLSARRLADCPLPQTP